VRRPSAGLLLALGGLFVGCGEDSDAITVQMTVRANGCDANACEARTSGAGLMWWSDDGRVLYAETRLPQSTTAIVEIRFGAGQSQLIRYREIKDGQVHFRGQILNPEVRSPGHDGTGPVTGSFSFYAKADGAHRRVQGVIIPNSNEAVRVSPGSESTVQTPTHSGCSGEIYIPPPPPPDPISEPLPDDPWQSDPEPWMPEPGHEPEPWTPDPEPGNHEESPEPEWVAPADSGCEGDSSGYEADPDPGWGGDDYETAPAADSGCEGDAYESGGDDWGDDSSMSSADSGCEGDEYDTMSSAAVLPVFASLWRLTWPLGLAGLFNRRARRRRRNLLGFRL